MGDEIVFASNRHDEAIRMKFADFRKLEAPLVGQIAELPALDNPAFNLSIDDVPRGDEDKEYFLWHIRILPRLVTPAGFELGSGMSINTVLPENAAVFLEEVPVALNGATQVA